MQRDYILLNATVGLCPHCLGRLDAKILERAGRVYISRWCPEHGAQLDLLEEDRDYYVARNDYATPATSCRTQTAIRSHCPLDCGLCPNHEQHTCIGLIEITGACDLNCPVCYASSGEGSFLSADTFARMLDFAIESEGGSLDILQLSGGEPTMHPDLEALINLARSKDIKYVLLNTNGLNLIRHPALVEHLAAIPDRFEVYLQFDGLAEASYQQLRGRRLAELKLEALEVLSRNRIPTTLVASIAAGINEQEIGAIVAQALRTPFVRGVSFQPLAYFGRVPAAQIQRTRRSTLSGIVRELETQMKGMIRQEHLVPLPCDVDRVAIGYFHKAPDGSFAPMITRREARANLASIPNTLRFSPDDFLARIPNLACSSPACCGALADKMLQFFPRAFFNAPNAAAKARIVSETTFRITITSFVDAYNFDLRSCQRECVHVIMPDRRKIPFSAYNLHHRHRGSAP
jgi:7,8-dihydro-6-hydroxymethylpterin dimethyltransferase